ncbi:Peroxisomal membrane 22 kDa (Mpv17/PMP22) family protein [Rhynchospora pubera]|uniref:Peroxisomal membrane 22 kDa (Mpv17/PMP22) family protein n=1 Tax=Rhynchospora pubera TaxID=906938 RepID=A0AAV8E5B0_9POAL|nr:Peroxisomal membrane 22 kDa (Mpv17/PMP22) family protein [Rhynchospora pubera]
MAMSKASRGLFSLIRHSAPPPRPYIRPHLISFRSKGTNSSSASVATAAAAASAAAAAASVSARSGFVSWYLGMIEARPILTKSITAGVIFTAADFSSQMITIGPDMPYDPMRTLRMATYGVLLSGPSLHLWFNFLSRVLPKRDLITTFKKMILGQTLYGPIINSVFFSFNAALQGESIPEIIARLKRDLIPTFKNGLIYWPLCDFITFKFVPVRLQPLVSNSFAFLWTIYITYMAGLKKPCLENVKERASAQLH